MTNAEPPEGYARTERLELHRPTPGDVAALFDIFSDWRVWTHFPSLRHTDPEHTADVVDRWIPGWTEHGLDTWVVRSRDHAVVGYAGCSLRHGTFWNLGYRFAASAQGQGYATEVATEAIRHARDRRPDVPIVAYLLEHNRASEAVARKVGMSLVHRGPDTGNPDPAAVRLVYADRPLSDAQLAATMR